ncbi:MAG: hypothetical protein R3C54_01655 [Parvularculaceae bacterium]
MTKVTAFLAAAIVSVAGPSALAEENKRQDAEQGIEWRNHGF